MNLPVPLTSRPSVYHHPLGWTEILSVHDGGYLEAKRIWKRRLTAAHPDRLNQTAKPQHKSTGVKFKDLMKSYRKWLLTERRYYWERGHLMPPDWKGSVQAPPDGFAAHKKQLQETHDDQEVDQFAHEAPYRGRRFDPDPGDYPRDCPVYEATIQAPEGDQRRGAAVSGLQKSGIPPTHWQRKAMEAAKNQGVLAGGRA